MTNIQITGPDELTINQLRERVTHNQPIRALIGNVAMNVVLSTPIRNATSYGLGHLQYQGSNTIRWSLQAVDGKYRVVGTRV